MTKQCSKCGKRKSVDDFYFNMKAKDHKDSWCKECKKSYVASFQKKHRKQTASNKIKWSRLNADVIKAWVSNNKERVFNNKKKYALNNPKKVKASKIKWYKNNPKKRLANCRRYQASKLNATPKWLTPKQLKEMDNIYLNCPKGYHVDHIIPLRGKEVWGLHVPWNLQYLRASENMKKSNKVVLKD